MLRTQLILCAVLVSGCGTSPPAVAPPEPAAESRPPRSEPLAPGSLLPKLDVAGWIADEPPAKNARNVRLLVIDVWASWCPFCRQSAPGLARLHSKYEGSGVAFVSVSGMSREATEVYGRQNGVKWASGYGLSDNAITALGADSGMSGPGYGVAPVLYLADPDRRIVWNDRQGRFRHVAAEDWLSEVNAAIQTELERR